MDMVYWISAWCNVLTTISIYFTSQKVSTIILLLLLFFYCDGCTFCTWLNGVRMRGLQQRTNTGEQAEVQRKQIKYINRSQARSVRHICNKQLNMSHSHIQRVDITVIPVFSFLFHCFCIRLGASALNVLLRQDHLFQQLILLNWVISTGRVPIYILGLVNYLK